MQETNGVDLKIRFGVFQCNQNGSTSLGHEVGHALSDNLVQ